MDEQSSSNKSFADRIKSIIKVVGSREKLGKISGISATMIGKYEMGKSEPRRDKLIAIAEAVNVNMLWLLSGEGPMTKGDRDNIDVQIPDTSDPEIHELLSMTKHILESKTEYSNSLSANIRSFHRSVEMEKRLSRIENVINEERQTTQQRLSDIESKLQC